MATKEKKAKAKDQKETTSKVKTLKATKLEKKKEKVVKEITPINKDALMEQVISKREIKYVYPADCTDTLARKQFRQKVRNKIHALENQLFKLGDKTSKEYRKIEKELKAFQAEMVKPNVAI